MLTDKLYPRLIEHGFDSFLDYYYLLKYDSAASEEWSHLMDALSVPETYFWRESDQIEALVNVLLPEYITHCHQPLTIWSAACATGEEPISIAIALSEAGLFDKTIIKIYGSDASPSAIEKAKTGLFRERSFRNLSSYLKSKYFTKEDDYWRVSTDIHKLINWQVANLLNPSEIRNLTKANFIFCRNVFIYFSEQSIKKTVQQFYQGMSKPGYLFISASESLFKLKTEFEIEEIAGAFVYVKK
jgi:chemotaxis protein methyltransferase CheR